MIWKLIVPAVLFLASSSAYSQDKAVDRANKKVEKAENKLDKAKDEAKDTYESEWKEFKRDTEDKIDKNKEKIKELRRHKTSDPEQQTAYNKKIDKLEAENDKLRKDLRDYDYNGKDDWQKFKNDINNRMDKIGDALEVATD